MVTKPKPTGSLTAPTTIGTAGATVLHAPREWPQYRFDYYATFFLDPDGFRIEVATARDGRELETAE